MFFNFCLFLYVFCSDRATKAKIGHTQYQLIAWLRADVIQYVWGDLSFYLNAKLCVFSIITSSLYDESIDVEITEITVNYLGKPAKQVMIRNITEPKRAKEAMLRATVAELVKQELEKKLLSARGRARSESWAGMPSSNHWPKPEHDFVKNRQVNTFLSIKLLQTITEQQLKILLGKAMHISIVIRSSTFYPTTNKEVVETLQRKVTEEHHQSIPIKRGLKLLDCLCYLLIVKLIKFLVFVPTSATRKQREFWALSFCNTTQLRGSIRNHLPRQLAGSASGRQRQVLPLDGLSDKWPTFGDGERFTHGYLHPSVPTEVGSLSPLIRASISNISKAVSANRSKVGFQDISSRHRYKTFHQPHM